MHTKPRFMPKPCAYAYLLVIHSCTLAAFGADTKPRGTHAAQVHAHTGDYETEADAAVAFDRATICTRGYENAATNFPRECYREEAAKLESEWPHACKHAMCACLAANSTACSNPISPEHVQPMTSAIHFFHKHSMHTLPAMNTLPPLLTCTRTHTHHHHHHHRHILQEW